MLIKSGEILFCVILVRQEKIAILVLVVVIAVVLVSALVLESAGKGSFSRPYGPGSAEGELVHHQGVVEKSTMTASGGHNVLLVSGVRVFVPSMYVQQGWPRPGDEVTVYGKVQTYRGEREILVGSISDIAPVSLKG